MMCILLHNLTFRKWKNTFFSSAKFDMWCPKKNPSKPNTQLQIAILSDTCNDHIFQYNYLRSKVSTYFLHSIKYSETYFFIEFGHKKIKFSTFYSNNFEQCANCIFFFCLAAFACFFVLSFQRLNWTDDFVSTNSFLYFSASKGHGQMYSTCLTSDISV